MADATLFLSFKKAYNDEIIEAVGDAIDAGYRHFDGALFYANEVEVGQAIQQKIEQRVVEREDLFIVSKVSVYSCLGTGVYCWPSKFIFAIPQLWCTFLSSELVEPSLRKSLKDLQLDYLDLYVMHWPMAFEV